MLTTFTDHVLTHGVRACASGHCYARSTVNEYVNKYMYIIIIYTTSNFLYIWGSLMQIRPEL